MVNTDLYIPERGDIVCLTFNPQAGHEQSGYRPAIVLSPANYNKTVGLCLLCPITSKIKGYPFEVELPEDLSVHGAVLSDQVKSLDWRARSATFKCKAPKEILENVINLINTIIN